MGSVEGLADLVDSASLSLAVQAGCRIVWAAQKLTVAHIWLDAVSIT